MDQEFSNLSSYTKQQKASSPKKKAFLYVLLFVLLIGGAIFAGNYFFSTQKTADDNNPVAQATATPTEEPTPTLEASDSASVTPSKATTGTPTPTSKASPTPSDTVAAKLRIEVLNGSGTSGEASKMASFLKNLGYAISGTGNADAFDYTKTVIQIKKSKNSAAAQLRKDLATEYAVDPTVQTLAESATPDAIVIVGTE